MAGRATYTEQDKARVYVVLTANDGNVKRTSRETDVPENTVRRWRNEFEKDGPPPADVVESAVGDFVTEAEEVRKLGIEVLKARLEQLKADPKGVNVGQVATLIGILTDKLDRARGLDSQRVDHHHHLPSADEARELLGAFFENSRALAKRNTAEIVDAEVVEQPALPSGQ